MKPMGMAWNSFRTEDGMAVVGTIIEVDEDGIRHKIGQIEYTPEQAITMACQVIEAAGGKR